MPSPVLESAQQRASEEMTGMSFLEHLEELRRRIIFSCALHGGRLRRLLVVSRADLRLHAEAHHLGAGQSPPRPEAGLPESHRSLQHVPEDLVSGRDLRGLAVHSLSGLGLHRAGTLSQRAALRSAFHVLARLGSSSPAAGSATGWSIRRRWTSSSASAGSSRR